MLAITRRDPSVIADPTFAHFAIGDEAAPPVKYSRPSPLSGRITISTVDYTVHETGSMLIAANAISPTKTVRDPIKYNV